MTDGSEESTAESASSQVIENPIAGERVTFLRRGDDTDGELVELELVAEPFAAGPPEHVHDHQEEFFEILAGSVTGTLDGEPFTVSAGESFVVSAGTPHGWWNDRNEALRARVEVRPALEIAEFLETVYGLAADGKTNAKGIPNPLQMAVIADHYWETNDLVTPPDPIQKLVFGLLAPLGRLIGYRAFYPEYSTRRAPAE
ncbi:MULTISPECIES: cupin domain-containing protein [Natrialbaceae]|uniref:cupin domain-containing protein n=1 Tax=Natrialbaceae TaxID=1644061 RepID=UPI00207C9991|nr:cupin domain-containing protein [Natronococcus sp. CG52]